WAEAQEQGFEAWRSQEEQNFYAWLEYLQDILDENVAGNLLNLIESHKTDRNNPHNVTPEQIGAETPVGAQAKAEAAAGAVQAELDAHKAEIATSTQLGHVKVGQNLTIDSDGTLHAQASGGKKVARFVIGTSTAGWTE